MVRNVLTLWIVSVCNDTYCELCPVYAHDEQGARAKAADWLYARCHLPQLDLKSCPNGFIIHRSELPGKMEVEG